MVADPASGINAQIKTTTGMMGLADEIAIELKYALYSYYVESSDLELNQASFWSYKAVAIRCLQYIDPATQNLGSGYVVRPTFWCGFKKTNTKF